MFSSFPRSVCISLLLFCALAFARDLRVCADPNNLPFSNNKRQGFENRIAELVAQDLQLNLVYQWQRMGRGFVRDFMNTGECEVLIGIPANFKPVLTTAPYYRSSYVFVTRKDGKLKPASLDDPVLHQLKIGVQVLEEDYTPPATALARRHLQNQIVGFDTTGEDADSIIRAVADQKLDTAIVWGPLAGFFAKKDPDLELTPVTPPVDPPALPFTFSIAMGVCKGNNALRDELENVIEKRQDQINSILDDYGVPRLEMVPRLASESHGATQ